MSTSDINNDQCGGSSGEMKSTINKVCSCEQTDVNNITEGGGLDPIRESVVLERIDLSLVSDYENPTIDPEPPFSSAIVIPILENILNTENNSLIHVQLPKKWREERSDLLTQFLQRFDRMLNERRLQCSKGCGVCEGREDEDDFQLVDQLNGVIIFTCYQCMKHFCSSCYMDNYEIDFCKCCEKVYCVDCNEVNLCDPCQGDVASCKACDVVKVW